MDDIVMTYKKCCCRSYRHYLRSMADISLSISFLLRSRRCAPRDGAMYSGEDGELFVELGYVGKDLSASKAKQPDKSRIGGKPAWFGEAPVPHEQLVCRLCGRNLFLVAQVHAPTHIPRSLCVFGCNRAACSTTPQGWRVIRTQQPQPLHDDSTPASSATIPTQTSSTTNTIPETAVSPAPPITNMSTDSCRANAPSWDEGGGGGYDWGYEGGEGDWGDTALGGDSGVGLESLGEADLSTTAIDALLTEQECRSRKQIEDRLGKVNDRLQNSTIESNTTIGNDHKQKQNAGDVMEPTIAGESNEADDALTASPGQLRYSEAEFFFPVKAIDFSPEPLGADLSSDKDLDMENRIRRYREHEEDRNLIAALDQALEVGSKGARSKPGTASTAPGIGEKYERTPARAKAVLRFAERVARAPQQIVRYAYGGMPLWSASDAPKDNIPPCKCGSARVFEMQLMPALLLRLPVNDFAEPGEEQSGKIQVDAKAKTAVGDDREVAQSQKDQKCEVFDERESTRKQDSPSDDDDPVHDGRGGWRSDDEEGGVGENVPPAPSAEDRARLRTWGMDWGVVTVWCCPRSCNSSYEETVVVQPPV